MSNTKNKTKAKQRRKPVIGIIAKHPIVLCDNCAYRGSSTYIFDNVAGAVFDNGGMPIALLPVDTDKGIHARDELFAPIDYDLDDIAKQRLIDSISLCDGIILQGGRTNDHYELFVAKYCYDNDIPILGICAGHQIMAHVHGGKTGRNDPKHFASLQDEFVHDIDIVKGTMFCKLVGLDILPVNSAHNFCVTEVPPGFRVTAMCANEDIEAMEAIDKSFYMSVQFHPECLYSKDVRINKIFKALVKACK